MNNDLVYIFSFIVIIILGQGLTYWLNPLKKESVALTGTLKLTDSFRSEGWFTLTDSSGQIFHVTVPLEKMIGKGKDETVTIHLIKSTYRSGKFNYIYDYDWYEAQNG